MITLEYILVFLFYFALVLGAYGSINIIWAIFSHIRKYDKEWYKYYYYVHIEIKKYNWWYMIPAIVILLLVYTLINYF